MSFIIKIFKEEITTSQFIKHVTNTNTFSASLPTKSRVAVARGWRFLCTSHQCTALERRTVYLFTKCVYKCLSLSSVDSECLRKCLERGWWGPIRRIRRKKERGSVGEKEGICDSHTHTHTMRLSVSQKRGLEKRAPSLYMYSQSGLEALGEKGRGRRGDNYYM